jgi:hypothetical protein
MYWSLGLAFANSPFIGLNLMSHYWGSMAFSIFTMLICAAAAVSDEQIPKKGLIYDDQPEPKTHC